VQLPNTEQFRRSVNDFKERLKDTKIIKLFEKNSMADIKPADGGYVKPIEIKIGDDSKLKLGVRRESGDVDGNKYQTSSLLDGKRVQNNLSKAAGLEH
jgi:hypothetical protein